jgi:hypothetical protein
MRVKRPESTAAESGSHRRENPKGRVSYDPAYGHTLVAVHGPLALRMKSATPARLPLCAGETSTIGEDPPGRWLRGASSRSPPCPEAQSVRGCRPSAACKYDANNGPSRARTGRHSRPVESGETPGRLDLHVTSPNHTIRAVVRGDWRCPAPSTTRTRRARSASPSSYNADPSAPQPQLPLAL